VIQNGLFLHGAQERLWEVVAQGPNFCIWIQTADTEIWRATTYSADDIRFSNIEGLLH